MNVSSWAMAACLCPMVRARVGLSRWTGCLTAELTGSSTMSKASSAFTTTLRLPFSQVFPLRSLPLCVSSLFCSVNLSSALASTQSKERERMAEFFSNKQVADFREAFKFFDRDGNGFITKEELGMVMQSLNEQITEEQLEDMIKKVDEDNNKVIDFNEFVNLMARKRNDMDFEGQLLEAFDIFDKDNNGYISAQELQQVMVSLGENMSEAEVEEMLRAADLDGDKQINYQEFVHIMMAKN